MTEVKKELTKNLLAPFSDIDLLFLTNDDKNDRTQAAVSFILYLLMIPAADNMLYHKFPVKSPDD